MDLSLPRIKYEDEYDYDDEYDDLFDAVGDSSSERVVGTGVVTEGAGSGAGAARHRTATTTAHGKLPAAAGGAHPPQPQGNHKRNVLLFLLPPQPQHWNSVVCPSHSWNRRLISNVTGC
ncbi:hypothetical protein O0L34_g10385 [Tuta absoluta]|nr:hypothetical protein O0L34_g10385 [Tuta absoluta]